MKREDIKINKNNHFIGSWIIDDTSINEIIDYFNKSYESLEASKTSQGKIDKLKKDSMNLSLNAKKIKKEKLNFFVSYFNHLKDCLEDYKNQWDLSSDIWKEMQIGNFTLEKFPISGHHDNSYYDRNNLFTSHKTLSWLTFLNDLEGDEGELFFKYYEHSIKPKKGLTLIFPSDWMHSHQQKKIFSKEKFTIRGNFGFVIKK